MALTEAQYTFIDNAICHFIGEGVETKDQFFTLLVDLNKAFHQTLSATDELFQLQQCIHQPNRFFQRLETFNPHNIITCGQVQISLLDIITKQLATLSDKLGITLNSADWPISTLQQTIAQLPNFSQAFHSHACPFDSSDQPSQFIMPSADCLYLAHLAPDPTTYTLQLFMSIQVPDQELIHKQKYIASLPFLNGDEEDNDAQMDTFVKHHMSDANLIAKMYAAKAIIQHLIFADVIPAATAFSIPSAAKQLLTYKFYFYQIKERGLCFSRLFNLKEYQYQNLIHPPVIALLKYQLCDFEYACELKPSIITLLKNPIFLELLRLKKITLNDLATIALKAIKYTCLPVIGHLIFQHHLTLDQLNILKPMQIKSLKQEAIYHLILKGHLTINDLLALSKRQLSTLHQKPILNILQTKKYSLRFIDFITTPFYIKYLKQHPEALNRWENISPDIIPYLLSHPIKRLLAKQIITFEQAECFTPLDMQKISGDALNQLVFDREMFVLECLSLPTLAIEKLESHPTLFSYLPRDAKERWPFSLTTLIFARFLLIEFHHFASHTQNHPPLINPIHLAFDQVIEQTSLEAEQLKLALIKLFLQDLQSAIIQHSKQSGLHSIERCIANLLTPAPLDIALSKTLTLINAMVNTHFNKSSSALFAEFSLLKKHKITAFHTALMEYKGFSHKEEMRTTMQSY